MIAAKPFEEPNFVTRQDGESAREPGPGAKLSFLFICLFIVAIYARPEDVFPFIGSLHLTLILGVCAGASFLWALLLGDVSLSWPVELRLVLLLTAWFAVGVPFAYWRGGSLMVFTQVWLKTVLIFFLLTQTLVTPKRIRCVLWAIILSELAVTLYSLAAPSQLTWKACLDCGAEGMGDRMVGVNQGLLYWNALGLALGMIIPYMAALFISKPSMLRSTLLAATIASMSWMQVLTASRSGTLVVVFSVILTSLVVTRGSPRGRVVRVGTALALVATICMAPAVFWQRIDTLFDGDSASANAVQASADDSKQERATLLMRSVTYTIEHPLFGLGLGNFDVANGTELATPDAWIGSHNTYTQISSEAGIPALLMFVALLGTILHSMKRVMRETLNDPQNNELNLMARATFVSLLSFMLGAFFAHKGYDYYVYTAPIGVAVGIRQIAATTQAVTARMNLSLASQQQYLDPGWTL